MNYFIIALVLIGVVIVLLLLIKKNRKDQREFEQKVNQEDIDPERHKGDRI